MERSLPSTPNFYLSRLSRTESLRFKLLNLINALLKSHLILPVDVIVALVTGVCGFNSLIVSTVQSSFLRHLHSQGSTGILIDDVRNRNRWQYFDEVGSDAPVETGQPLGFNYMLKRANHRCWLTR